MPLKPSVRIGRSKRRRGGATRYRPKAVVTIGNCGSCGKEYVNPVTHMCTGGGDFAKRAAAEKKAVAAARRAENKHEYAECDDGDCTSYPCRVYREGSEHGRAEGWSDGYAAGAASAGKE